MDRIFELMNEKLVKEEKENPDKFKELQKKNERFTNLMTCKDLTTEEEKELSECTKSMEPRNFASEIDITCTRLLDDDLVITSDDNNDQVLRKSINNSILDLLKFEYDL